MAPEDVGQSSAGRLRSISSSDNNIATVPTVSNNGVEQIETLLMPLPSRRQLFIKPDVCYHKSAAGVEYQLPKREKYSDTRPQPWDFDEPVLAPRWKHQAYPLAIRSNSTPRGREVHTSHGDLFPWDGTQPEDHLNISIIQDGFFDQYLNVQPEPVSARTSIVTGIRNKMGLTHLSQSLISALTIRGERGHITMPSTFKPPPRVTLTDTKREVWLKDLSDRNISLRRLSRTIPHGIRGRMLLEHCLSKGIPLSRVIWLSKCVGANELRSFRRKGALALSHAASAVSGEFRYIRDWTASLEQFVGCLKIPHLNDVDWLSRMTYSVRLASALYDEQLLERAHYLDWIITGVGTCPLAVLPWWLLSAQLVWVDLIKARKHAERLFQALLTQSHALTKNNDVSRRQLMQPLQLKLDTLIRSLVLAVPEAFVSMADVQPHGIIHRRSQKPDLDLTKMGMIGKVQVDPTALCDCLLSSQTWQQQLLALLDTTPFAPIPTDLAERCWMSGGDGRALVTLMLDWCTSPIRHGVARLFLVGEILQSWHKTRFVDVTSLIIHYIDARSLSYTPKDDAGDRSRSPIDPDRSLYKLISILAASGAFSAPRYIQWLIAHGLVLTTMDISFSGPCLTRLLVEIPESTLTSAVQRLRATILARNMLDGGEPRRLVAETLYLAGLATGSYLPHPPLMPLTDQTLDRLANPCELIDSQSCRQTSLDIVCDRLRLGSRSLQVHVSTTVAAAFKSWVRSQKDSCIKLSFSAVRAILEAAADYSALADIIHTMAPSSSIPTLMVCVDAVCMNLDVFKALGRVGLLHTTLSKRWNIVASDGQSDASIKPTIAALGLIAEQLYNPSPAIGDNMYDPYVSIRRSCEHHPTLPSDSSYLRDQQARLQRCGTNQVVLGGYGHKGQPRIDLNENSRISTAGDETNAYNNVKTLARPHSLQYPPSDLLNSMIAQFETYWTEGAHYEVKRLHACQLGLLRPRNTALFDQRMSQWITHVRSISSRPHLNGAFPILVAYGCLDVSMLLKTRPFHDTTPQVFQAGYGSPPSSPLSRPFGFKTYHQEALQLLVDSSCVESVLSEEETGCYYMRLRSARILYPSAFLSLIRHAIAEHDKLLGSPRLPPSMLLPLDQTRCQLGILECLRYLIPLHVDEAIRIFAGHGLDLSTITLISRIIIHLLFNGDGDIGVGFWDPVDISAHQLSKTFSDLTLPFCKLKLHLDFLYAQMVDRSKGPAGQKLNILLDELASLIQTAITTDDHDHTLRFVSCAAYGMKLLLSSRLETVLMQMIPMLASCKNFTRHYEHGHRCEAPSDGNIHVAWRIARVLDTFIAKYRLLPQSDVATPTFDAARPNLAAASIGLFKLPDVRSGKTRPRISFRQASVEVWLPLLMQLDSCVVSRITRQSRHTGRAKTSVALHPQSHAHKLNVAKVAPIAPSPNFSTSSCDVTVLIMSAIDRGLTSIGLSGDISYASLSQERLLGVLLDHDHDTLKNAYTNCVRLLQRHAIMRLPSKKPLQALRVSGSASDQRIRYILGYPMTPSPNLVIVSRRKLDILQSLYHQSAGLKGSSYQGLTRLQNQVATRSKKAHRIGRMIQFSPRTWEILNEPTPFMGPNDTTLSLTLFDASKLP